MSVGTADDPSAYDSGSTGSNADFDVRGDTTDTPLVAGVSRQEEAPALLYQHPDYLLTVGKWDKYIDCYRANDIYQFIHKHPREHQDVFAMRIKRGYYFNYVASIVDLYVAYLFEGGVTRDPGNSIPMIEEFYEDADRAGTNYNLFMQIAATFAICTGHAGILVDMPQGDESIKTEADQKKKKVRPYLSLIQAQQILDWELDEFGNFEWVKIQENRPQERDWQTTVDTDSRYFLIWTKTNWERWKWYTEYEEEVGEGATGRSIERAVKIGDGNNPLGEVPVVILKNNRDLAHAWFGDSAVRDIVDINLAILNWCSFADEEVANRCLNILTMQRDETDKPVEISHYNVIEYAEGAAAPAYLTPGETPLKLIWEAVDQARNEIYRLAKLSGSTGLLGVREATSGIAYAFEFNETNQSLCKKAEFLEQAEIEVHRLVGRWLKKDFDGAITYPREFGVDDFLTELQILAESRATLSSDTAIKEVEKKVTSKMFAKSKQKLRKKIETEIEEAEARPMGVFESFGSVPSAMTGVPGGKQGDTSGKEPSDPTSDPKK